MSSSVFRVWCADSSVPLTVYAPNTDEATETFAFWCAINMPGWSRQPVHIETLTEAELAQQPQLSAAVARARTVGMHDAVLLFRNHDAGWLAVGCNAERIGSIAPPEPLVRSFEACIEVEGLAGVDALVFAHDAAQATQHYMAHKGAEWFAEGYSVTITEFSRWTLTGKYTQLREDMDMGSVGIAGQSQDGAWRIYPPEHERAGGY